MTEDALALQPLNVWSLPRQESRLRTIRRRVVSIPLFLLALVAYTAISPALYLVSFVVDIALRRRLASVRAFAMVHVFLLCEAAGIFATAWIWLRHRGDRRAFLDANYALQAWWAGTLYRAGVRLFSLNVEVEGGEAPAEGPVLVFARHVSPIDNLLPAVLVSVEHGIRLRWVINRSLLRDPCLDIVGNRLPNCFVANSSGDSDKEIRRVEALGRELGPDDGVLIFPEGGLFSPTKRARVIERLEAGGIEQELLEHARSLQNLLPPRLGGSLALLDSASGVDAVFIAHTGLESATRYQSILGGQLIGSTVRIRMWRVPATKIPSTGGERIAWLYEQWHALDAWVTHNREGTPHA
ncbi:MAG TPA: 1-acyl-sn-glycerol-3-phosphate acyltransferase, partial [Tepidiformaceae bacterium]|nr:1-acyl-sn-glycerol-3-phosphate acyltransferase [Tepidiformaceae bacterium]HMO96643.1 1-acyl-sn-glycerol-3-phosphate acyltransferase [Tepidiformaceae bacterium]